VSIEQFIALLGAVTALVVALGAILVQLRQTHQLVNSRLSALLELTATASRAEGVIQGQHDALTQKGPVPPETGSTGPHGPKNGL